MKAARAALTAASTSAAVPSVISASEAPVAGLSAVKVLPGLVHLPSMKWPNLRPLLSSQAMA
ncbi:hypothetical protein D3C87_1803720 [compost metagenome]